jgi:hypothetical protein
MNPLSALQPVTPAEVTASAETREDYILHVVQVYEDAPAERWAGGVCERVSQLVGSEGVQFKAWKISELSASEAFADAVLATACADMIIVSIQAAEQLPLELYAWMDAWLPHRLQLTGALVALVGQTEQSGSQADRTRQYLQAVARKGGLDFLIEERNLAAASPAVSLDFVVPGTPPTNEVPYADFYQAPSTSGLSHWGINE